MEALFVLIHGLVSLSTDSKGGDVQRHLDMEFSKKPSSHEVVTFYENENPVIINSELTIKKVNISIQNSPLQMLRISLRGLAHYCVSKEQLQSQFGMLELIDPPRSPAPGAETSWGARLNGKRVSFGFANQARDYLESVTVHFVP